MLVLDIDYFEGVNDNYGHDAGDSVLRQFASRVRHNIRGIDLACRLGGEEFVVVMPDADLAKAYGERLRHALQRRRSMLARGSARWKSRCWITATLRTGQRYVHARSAAISRAAWVRTLSRM